MSAVTLNTFMLRSGLVKCRNTWEHWSGHGSACVDLASRNPITKYRHENILLSSFFLTIFRKWSWCNFLFSMWCLEYSKYFLFRSNRCTDWSWAVMNARLACVWHEYGFHPGKSFWLLVCTPAEHVTVCAFMGRWLPSDCNDIKNNTLLYYPKPSGAH